MGLLKSPTTLNHVRPVMTVVVRHELGGGELRSCLVSLAAQTALYDAFEVIVVADYAPAFDEAIEAVRQSHRELKLRSIVLEAPSSATARRLAATAARGRYLTFVASQDYVQPQFVAEMSSAARLDAIVVMRSDYPAGSGRKLTPAEVRVALSSDEAVVVPTSWAAAVARRHRDYANESLAFWADVLATKSDKVWGYHLSAQSTYQTGDVDVRQTSSSNPDEVARIEMVERLDGLLDVASDEARAIISNWIEDEMAELGRYIVADKSRRKSAISALDRSTVVDVPYGAMNSGQVRGLAISYCFPPYADASAVVAAKRVRERGQVVDVIYNAMDRIRQIDIATRRIAGPFIAQEAVVASPTAFSSWSSIDGFREHGLRQIFDWEVRGREYETVYSRAQFAASHFLASAFKLQRPSVRWTAEFSDPLSRDVEGNERGAPIEESPFLATLRAAFRNRGVEPPRSQNLFIWCEWIAYVLADEILFTNANQLSYMTSYCPRDVAQLVAKKATIAPHPTLPGDFYRIVRPRYAIDSNKINIGYFGNFYATRGLDEVLRTISVVARSDLHLHVFTSKPDELRGRVDELGIGPNVSVNPYVEFLEFLALTRYFDWLIVNDANTGLGISNPYLPSKWSDYRGSGSRVWGIVEEGSPLSSEPLDMVSRVGDEEATRDVFQKLGRSSRDADRVGDLKAWMDM